LPLLSCPSLFSFVIRPPLTSTLFPYTTLFRSRFSTRCWNRGCICRRRRSKLGLFRPPTTTRRCTLSRPLCRPPQRPPLAPLRPRSEEHTSELQSRFDLVCRLLLEKKTSPARLA